MEFTGGFMRIVVALLGEVREVIVTRTLTMIIAVLFLLADLVIPLSTTLLFPRRCHRATPCTTSHPAVWILRLLLRWFQYLIVA